MRQWFDNFYLMVLHMDIFPSLPRLFWLFHDLGVSVVTSSWFLGGFVGEQSLAADFVSNKVKVWCDCIQQLSVVAIVEPQASFAALARSLWFE